MKIGMGAVRLATISNGVLAAGRVPFARMFKLYAENKNVGVISCPSGVGLELFELDFGTLVLGDVPVVCVKWEGTKGGTAGEVRMKVSKKSGTGQCAWPMDFYTVEEKQKVAGTDDWAGTFTMIGKVWTAGTYIMAFTGISYLSNFDVPSGSAQGSVHIM